jgi:hypothetical protein
MSYACYNKILNTHNLDSQEYATVRKSEMDKKTSLQSCSFHVLDCDCTLYNIKHKMYEM